MVKAGNFVLYAVHLYTRTFHNNGLFCMLSWKLMMTVDKCKYKSCSL